ncbi:MAG: hypothetical protein HWD85_07970 [Flavobacteriaceae bacterium]|nr:hypothetical protein [Flavobacteriaceae bacterium]
MKNKSIKREMSTYSVLGFGWYTNKKSRDEKMQERKLLSRKIQSDDLYSQKVELHNKVDF